MTDQTPQEYFKGFPEAPASDTFRWIDNQGFEHMTTIRAWTASALSGEISKFVAKVTENGGRSSTPPAAPKSNAPLPSTGSGDTLWMNIDKIKVTPEVKDGKKRILVELFSPGHKYADIKAYYNDANSASAAFSAVTGLDFSSAGEFSLDCVAHYRHSDKKKQNGEPYKNLVSVSELPF